MSITFASLNSTNFLLHISLYALTFLLTSLNSMLSIPNPFARLTLTRRVSYSATFFVDWKLKWITYSIFRFSVSLNTTFALRPFYSADPSTKNFQFLLTSFALDDNSTLKSTRAWALIAFSGVYLILWRETLLNCC